MLALEREASLRVEPGMRVQLTCLSGVLWITQEGDWRDLFLGPGQSFELSPRGVAVVTALEAASVRVLDVCLEPRRSRAWWAVMRRALALRSGLAAQRCAAIELRPAAPGGLETV